jgi:alpha-1,3-rhamnosyl/mannosyltransferase
MSFVFDARTANAHYPGIGRYTFELANALAQITELTILINPLETSSEMDVLALPARRIAVPHTPRSLAQQWTVPARLRRARARLYHSPFYLMPYWPGAPTVLTLYDVLPLTQVDPTFTAAQRTFYRAAHTLAINAARRVITLSEAARRDFVERFRLSETKIGAVPPGLSERFTPQPTEAVAEFKRRRGLPDEYVLSVGINKPHKNLPALIRAHAALPASAPPLVIAGPEDPRFPEMRAAADQFKNRVMVLGRVPDDELPLLYSGAALYVQASVFEGFGFPVLEAMGCGAPVLCSELPVLRELAQEAALYFDPHDPASITQALAEALEQTPLRRALAERGLKRARHFTWAAAARRTLDIYHQVVS